MQEKDRLLPRLLHGFTATRDSTHTAGNAHAFTLRGTFFSSLSSTHLVENKLLRMLDSIPDVIKIIFLLQYKLRKMNERVWSNCHGVRGKEML